MWTPVLNYFLYFPEDKSLYLPAALELALIIIICVMAFRWIKRISRRQEEKAKQIEEQMKQYNKNEMK